MILTFLTAILVAVALASVKTAAADPNVDAKQGPGPGRARPDPGDRRAALACGRGVQPRQREARPDQRRPEVERAPSDDRAVEPAQRADPSLAAARLALRQRHRWERARGAARRGVARRPAQPDGRGRARFGSGRPRAARGEALPGRGQAAEDPSRPRSHRAGPGRRPEGRSAPVDRGPARRAAADALLDQERDRQPRGRGAAPAAAARGAGARPPRRYLGAASGRRRRGTGLDVRRPVGRGGARARPGCPLRRRRRGRDAVPRRALRLGRRQPVGLRLLWPDHVRVRADGRLAAPSRRVAVRHGHRGLQRPASSRATSSSSTASATPGIYIGGGQFIHAPHTGDVVKISSLSDSWYARTWVGARRI